MTVKTKERSPVEKKLKRPLANAKPRALNSPENSILEPNKMRLYF